MMGISFHDIVRHLIAGWQVNDHARLVRLAHSKDERARKGSLYEY